MNFRFFSAACLALMMVFPAICRAEAAAPVAPAEYRTLAGGRVWVYLPPGIGADAKVPCVVVPPAGSRLFHGMLLGEGDRPEHLPWVAAGFAVVSFDISGPLPPGRPTKDVAMKAMTEFTKARCGVSDALTAVQVALAKCPQIDAKRLYLSGHSSAGTLVLQIASASDQFKGCATFAPTIFTEQALGKPELAKLEAIIPGVSKTFHDLAPPNTVMKMGCPVFLFHAADDTSVPAQSFDTYNDMLQIAQKTVAYVKVPNGGHRDSMIEVGLPKAIAWVKTLDQKLAK
jgi:dipeptidyl aminopeptidase/acylaminoacyl peptidase